MTALWFACQRAKGDQDLSGALLAFDVTGLAEYATVVAGATWGAVSDPLGASFTEALQTSTATGRAFLVRPSLPDVRMTAQEGLFLAGATPAHQGIPGVESFPIPADSPPGPQALASLFSADERGPGRPQRLRFVALVIPSRLKKRMRDNLAGTYNRRRSVLFPDLTGFHDALRLGELDHEWGD